MKDVMSELATYHFEKSDTDLTDDTDKKQKIRSIRLNRVPTLFQFHNRYVGS